MRFIPYTHKLSDAQVKELEEVWKKQYGTINDPRQIYLMEGVWDYSEIENPFIAKMKQAIAQQDEADKIKKQKHWEEWLNSYIIEGLY